MRVPLIILMFVASLQAVGQSVPASSAFDTQLAVAPHFQPEVSYAPVEETKHRVFDRKFFMLAGMATAATVLDVATTSHCISTYAGCQEGNALLGSRPSTAKLYGVSFSILGGQLLASALLRRKTPTGKLWMVPPIITTAGHGIAAIMNFRTMHQLSSGQ
jgi:hypothetical protein